MSQEKWIISKEFGLDYGHRVWTQELNPEYSLDSKTVCRHLHGHRGTCIVYLKSHNLQNGMVVDFKHLNWFKQFLDDALDHKFIIDINDPLFPILFPLAVNSLETHKEQYKTIDSKKLTSIQNELPTEIFEMYSGLVVVDFVPTSENITKWLYTIVNEKMSKIGVETYKIEWFETPKSRSIYQPQYLETK